MQSNIPREQRFTPGCLIANVPKLRAVIDLTDTETKDRYYCKKDFLDANIDHLKMRIAGGGLIPGMNKIKEFSNAVEGFLRKYSDDPDALIGVHCTHGLNRTGYFICMYMVTSLRCDPAVAIDRFQRARGYEMYRQNFIEEIMTPGRHSSTNQIPCYGRENKAKSIRPIGNYTYKNDWLEDIPRPSGESNRGTNPPENRREGRKERHRVSRGRMRRGFQECSGRDGVGAEAMALLPEPFQNNTYRREGVEGFPRGIDMGVERNPNFTETVRRSGPVRGNLTLRAPPFQDGAFRRGEGFPFEVERFPQGNDMGVRRNPHSQETMIGLPPNRENLTPRAQPFQDRAYRREFEIQRIPHGNDMRVGRNPLEVDRRLRDFPPDRQPFLPGHNSRQEYLPLERNPKRSFPSDDAGLLPHPDGGEWTAVRSSRNRRAGFRRRGGNTNDRRNFRNTDRRMEYRSPLDDGSAAAFDRPSYGGYGKRGGTNT
ncbi:uncharacterized protein LOC123671177 isoform X2 [Harmonia axyridis]|nr:uncharacterized protein LOC123671177 isoform X2 [Harmonia axyridis]